MLRTVAVAGLIALAAPAHAQQQGSLIDPGASVVNEQSLLRQSPRIEGQTDLLDERERVLIQPAGRAWDHFHQVTLHWLAAIIIIGLIGLSTDMALARLGKYLFPWDRASETS